MPLTHRNMLTRSLTFDCLSMRTLPGSWPDKSEFSRAIPSNFQTLDDHLLNHLYYFDRYTRYKAEFLIILFSNCTVIMSEKSTSIKPPKSEEIANAITHGIGALISMLGLVTILILTDIRANPEYFIYGMSLVILYIT